MPAPTDRNRLDEEASPYLQAHADNPVHWQPWDDLALEAAEERDVPIFLSIGYAACHWCHVMAEESFEDESVAAQLNEHFVPVKLDREERPDIDSIYMTVCQVTNRAGCGWPLSVWLTPDGDPFYVGTYFPPESRQGQPGFADLLDRLAREWRENREELESRGRQWMAAARGQLESTPAPAQEPPGSDLLETAASHLVQRADRTYGGFGTGQKFPQPSRLDLLAFAASRTSNQDAETVMVETLDAMLQGGLRDHLAGGFHRYCVDREWVVPHFEKMLYDNGTIPRSLLNGFQLTGQQRYADAVEESFEFLRGALGHGNGGFYSTLDARSPPPGHAEGAGRGVEGAYYVWTPETVEQAIRENVGLASERDQVTTDGPDPDLLTDLVMDRFGITQAGNFEGETVLTLATTVSDLAREYELDEETVTRSLTTGEQRLLAAREERPAPPRDEKILAGWNGLVIDALAEGSLVLGADRYATWATEALEFLRETLWDGQRLWRRYKAPGSERGTSAESPGDTRSDGTETVAKRSTDTETSSLEEAPPGVKGRGMLEDYAFLANGALSVYQTTGSIEALSFALDLTRAMKDRFWDPERGTLFYTPIDGDQLPVRPQELADRSTPSSTGVAVQVFLAMDAFAPDADFDGVAERVLRTHAETLQDNPMNHASLVQAAEIQTNGHLEITIAAESIPAAWRSTIGARYLPDRLLAPRPATESGLDAWLETLGHEEAPPIWANRETRDGPTGYICRTACSPPVTALDELVEWIDEYTL